MKTKRKDISENKAEKLARKGLKKEIFLVYGILLLAYFLLAFPVICFLFSNPLSDLKDFTLIFAIPIIYLLTIVIYWFLRKPIHIQYAYERLQETYSKNFVDENFITGEPTDIILINTRDEAYKDFILGLPYVEKTYAILGNDNLISIYVKFKDTDAKHLDTITKEEFLTYCNVN